MTPARSPDRALWIANLVGWLLVAAYFSTLHDGLLDFMNHAIGRDFVNLWTAGRLTVEGRVGEVFQPEAFHAAIRAWIDPRVPYHFWSYPPPTLFLAAPLGLLPYGWALAAWSLFGVGALYTALRTAFAGKDLGLLLFSPAVACNLMMGQNGAVTAALLIAGLALMDRRPILSGVLMGLLVFKPQLGILLPVIVLAEGRWKTLVAAAVSGAALLLLSLLVFGLDAWQGFLGPTLEAQARMMTHGDGPYLWMMPSAFASGRIWGLTESALLLQIPFALMALVLAWKAWRSDAGFEDKLMVGLIAGLAASPQSFNYDLLPALAAALLLIRRQPREGPQAVAALVWTLPFLVIALNLIKLAAAPLLLAALLWFAYQRVRPAAAPAPSR